MGGEIGPHPFVGWDVVGAASEGDGEHRRLSLRREGLELPAPGVKLAINPKAIGIEGIRAQTIEVDHCRHVPVTRGVGAIGGGWAVGLRRRGLDSDLGFTARADPNPNGVIGHTPEHRAMDHARPSDTESRAQEPCHKGWRGELSQRHGEHLLGDAESSRLEAMVEG